MKKYFFYCLLLTLFSNFTNSQTFTSLDSIEIEQLRGSVFYDYFDRIISNENTIIPIRPVYSTDSEIVRFLVIDKEKNISFLNWKAKKNNNGGYESIYVGLNYPDNTMLLKSQYKLYKVEKNNNQLITKKAINLPYSTLLNTKSYNKIYHINYPSQTHVLLTNTYNNSDRESLFDVIRLAKFNVKRKKIEKEILIDVGKGIFYCHDDYQWISTSKDVIAVANPIKPEVYLLDNDLNVVDTIFVNFPKIYESHKILDSLLPKSYITEVKFNPYKMLSEIGAELSSMPKIEKISFINDDLLFIMINSGLLDERAKFINKRLHFVYSISQKRFYEQDGVLSDFYALNSTEHIFFIDETVFSVSDFVDDDNNFRYYLRYSKINIDFNKKIIGAVDLGKLPDFSKLETLNNSTITQSYYSFDYLFISDIVACANCRFDDKFKNLLIIHVFSPKERSDKSAKLMFKNKYEAMFNSPTVYFIDDSEINLKQLQKNKIYRIEKENEDY